MQNRETSEEFAREQENANKGWEICYGASAKAYLEWMDQMLEQGTAEAHEKLLAFFEDENKTAPYGNRSNAMIEMIVIMISIRRKCKWRKRIPSLTGRYRESQCEEVS